MREDQMAKTMIEKMEEAAGITSPVTPFKMPYGKGESIPGAGGVARPWTGPRPWKGSPTWLKVQETLKGIGS
jgi:hypothetical protein